MVRHGVEQGPALSTAGAAAFTAVVSTELILAALLGAAALRLRSTITWLLAGYVVLLGETTALTAGLSPFRFVDRAGVALGSTAFLAVAAAVWLRCGKQRPPRPDTRLGIGVVEWSLVAAVAASLLYQLVLGLTAPPNNWDSLTYHLARTAAWTEHRGIYWIPNAPTDRMNEFQPVAEQQILVLFVAMGRAALFALPQLLAELALVGAVFEAARRLGHSARASLFAALLFATFPLVALEGSTAQNDLVAAAPAAVAAALIPGGGAAELAIAGVALGLALGVKLTTLFVAPVVLLLAWQHGRRAFARLAAWSAGAFAVLVFWSFVLNLVHTHSLLGHGRERMTQQASPSLTGSPATLFRVVYNLFDLSGLSLRLTDVLAVAGVAVGLALAPVAIRRGRPALALAALPLLVPRLVPIAAHAAKLFAQKVVHLPIADPASTGGQFFWGVDYGSSEDLSAFGAIGGPLLLLLSLWYLLRRRGHRTEAIFALAFPLYLVLLCLSSKYNPWLARFLIVPAAFAAPLAAVVDRRRLAAAAVTVVAVLELVLVHVHNQQKPVADRPWSLTQAGAVLRTFRPGYAQAVTELGRLVPAGSQVGAAVGRDDPSFLLYGSRFERRVRYLPLDGAARAAMAGGLRYAVIAAGVPRSQFTSRGWTLHPLTPGPQPLWMLAVSPASGSA